LNKLKLVPEIFSWACSIFYSKLTWVAHMDWTTNITYYPPLSVEYKLSIVQFSCSVSTYVQVLSNSSLRFWKLTSLGGTVELETTHRRSCWFLNKHQYHLYIFGLLLSLLSQSLLGTRYICVSSKWKTRVKSKTWRNIWNVRKHVKPFKNMIVGLGGRGKRWFRP
jgi:hypothetical protein